MVHEQDIGNAAEAIRQGELVAFPTETVYGLGANALDAEAVSKIFELKRRPRFDPLIVHVASTDEVLPLVKHVTEAAAALIERFWPGPLSVVMPKQACVPDMRRDSERVGLLSFGKPTPKNGFDVTEVLSEQKCLREAATNLFAAIRRLDEQQLDLIVAEPVPETGLGRAIMDRLRRAAAT